MLKPTGKRFLAQQMKEKHKAGALLLTAERQLNICKILDCHENDEIKPGDIVMITPYGASYIELEGKKYLLLKEEHILGIIEDASKYEVDEK